MRLISGIVALLSFCVVHSPAAAESPLMPVTLRLHDYAGVRARDVTRAQAVVVRLYRQIGVTITWQSPRHHPSSGDHAQDPCFEERSVPGVELAMVVLAQSAGPEKPGNDDVRVLGSTPGTADAPGRLAYVFHDRLERVVRDVGRDPADILALVLAHEIGHLLLPHAAHTKRGVMRATWEIGDLRRLRLTDLDLGFTAAQRAEIHRRLAAPAPVHAGHTTAPAARAPL